MKTLEVLLASERVSHVSRYALESLERAVSGIGVPPIHPPLSSKSAERVVKLLSRAGALRRLWGERNSAILVPMMGLQESLLFPWVYSTEIIPVVFDCLPGQFTAWERLFRRSRIERAYFTASLVADHFRALMPQGHWRWLPEAIELGGYTPEVAWEDRSIDVLEFGRRYARFHDAVRSGLERGSIQHVYERKRGELVFATREDFVGGLARCRISVCFPQSQTHPERFGQIETLTQRYLESMASGCLILGSCPEELKRLFGYDPVVAVDWNDPVGQVTQLLSEPDRHHGLRRRNLEAVRACGSWDRRAYELLSDLASRGYSPLSREANSPSPSPDGAVSRFMGE
jgi:hypothetical protein